ncbi:MAG: Rieske 2Fe-2S domain-containing protein [Desulfobacterota bacterium]|jgi:cytochrome b6-f complex iron-sulfur subunit|nr:Rieske 2Fe-2S domain-containing protein [Thermodesulfobacteriota bacterium]
MKEKEQTKLSDSTKNTPPDPGVSRRSFLNTLWVILGILGLVEVVALILAFFQPRKTGSKEGESAGIIEAGAVDTFTPISVVAFVRGKFYLARLEDGGFLALSRKCTHLGCTVPWSPKDMKFVCPCHASVYDIRGQVVSAPAPRPLDLHPVFIENNIVKVDTNKVIKRSVFRPEQVAYAKK